MANVTRFNYQEYIIFLDHDYRRGLGSKEAKNFQFFADSRTS